MKVAFFDSGIGGLTVLKEAVKLAPDEKYIYYADSGNAPYGCRSRDDVRRLTLDAADRLAGLGIKLLVVACNTATSTSIDLLRERYPFPVVGMEPAVKTAVEKSGGKKILVLATSLTLKEEKFNSLVKRLGSENSIEVMSMQELVGMAEKFVFDGEAVEGYLRQKFKGIDIGAYSSIVLGCTHFSFFKEQISEAAGGTADVIDGNAGTARQMKKMLDGCKIKGNGFGLEVYISGSRVNDKELLARYMALAGLVTV